jgi:hypothetical protein
VVFNLTTLAVSVLGNPANRFIIMVKVEHNTIWIGADSHIAFLRFPGPILHRTMTIRILNLPEVYRDVMGIASMVGVGIDGFQWVGAA